MQSKYESEKKEQQITLLNKEKLLKDAELRRSNAERMHKIQELELSNKEKEMKGILLQKAEIENEAKAKENKVLKLDQKVKESELARAEAEKKQADELSKRRTQQLYGMIGVSLLVLAMLFLIFRGYRQKQKANKELTEKNDLNNQQKKDVEHQKQLVNEKNKEKHIEKMNNRLVMLRMNEFQNYRNNPITFFDNKIHVRLHALRQSVVNSLLSGVFSELPTPDPELPTHCFR